jgi:putative membrane protein
MIKLILRVVINAFSIWVASLIVEGFQLEGNVFQILLVGLVFGLVNALIKPFLKLISAPLIVLTLGLFTLILNTLLLIFTEWLMRLFTDSPVLEIDGLMPAFLASIIISLVSWVLSLLLGD